MQSIKAIGKFSNDIHNLSKSTSSKIGNQIQEIVLIQLAIAYVT